MSQQRLDFLVAEHQSRLLREAADERLAHVARGAKRPSGDHQFLQRGRPSRSLLWHSTRLLWHETRLLWHDIRLVWHDIRLVHRHSLFAHFRMGHHSH
jgi:hypothetical protein